MDLYARVNILDGRSVRLPRGNVADAITLDNDPLGRARNWIAQGADRLHVVDLDAAASRDYRNRDLIDRMLSSIDAPVQIAGGIRSPGEAVRLIEQGAWRVVMGTAAIEDQNMVWDLCRDHPDKIVVSLDVRPNEELAVRGWTENSGRFLEEVLVEMSSAGAAAFLVSEAGRDALLEPPDLGILGDALKMVEEPVIAAGGVRHLDDLRALLALESEGRRLAGVIVGREVTHGRFTFEEAKAVVAEGPPEPGTVVRDEPPIRQHVELADTYRLLAEACDQAASEARAAGQRILEDDEAGAGVHGSRVSGHLRRAGEILDGIPEG
jgi:phosphoribosylformimino-5-aminoimidazole carboxamide ribotide isomerase